MKEKLILVKLDVDYCNYLRKFDDKVPYNFDKKSIRPFIGVLFEINQCMYFAPLSSPKPKHLKLKSKLDLFKIDDGKLGVINFNNMLPVKENNIIRINLDAELLNEKEEKYFNLLREQLYWLNRNQDKLHIKSKRIYDSYIKGTLYFKIKNRCCNFPLLEEKCNLYNQA